MWFPVALWVAGAVPDRVGKEEALVVTYSLGFSCPENCRSDVLGIVKEILLLFINIPHCSDMLSH